VDSRSPFGARLRAIRTERHLSQEKLGKMIKVNRNFVGEVERGKQNICLDNIYERTAITAAAQTKCRLMFVRDRSGARVASPP
jgi:DNA-binding XRE family transcriptional regulator